MGLEIFGHLSLTWSFGRSIDLGVTSDDITNLKAALHVRTFREDLHVVLRLFDGDLATRVQRNFPDQFPTRRPGTYRRLSRSGTSRIDLPSIGWRFRSGPAHRRPGRTARRNRVKELR